MPVKAVLPVHGEARLAGCPSRRLDRRRGPLAFASSQVDGLRLGKERLVAHVRMRERVLEVAATCPRWTLVRAGSPGRPRRFGSCRRAAVAGRGVPVVVAPPLNAPAAASTITTSRTDAAAEPHDQLGLSPGARVRAAPCRGGCRRGALRPRSGRGAAQAGRKRQARAGAREAAPGPAAGVLRPAGGAGRPRGRPAGASGRARSPARGPRGRPSGGAPRRPGRSGRPGPAGSR